MSDAATPILTLLEQSQLYKQCNKNNAHEQVIALLHFALYQEGYRCVGVGEHAAPQDLPDNQKIPANWNSNQDCYTLKYKHYRKPDATFVVKFLTIGKQVLIHAMMKENSGKTSTMDIKYVWFKWFNMLFFSITDYVNMDQLKKLWSGDSSITAAQIFKDANKLLALFVMQISRSILPLLNKEGFEDAPTTTTTQQQAPQQIQQPQQPQPYYPDDPLRIPVRNPPVMPQAYPNYYYDEDFGAFGIGDNDLYPQVNPSPLFIGRGSGGMGGNLIGPNHPSFGPTMPQFRGRGSNFGDVPFGVPQGARFDPYMPPGIGANPSVGRARGRGRGTPANPLQFGPDNDHMPPPDSENPYYF